MGGDNSCKKISSSDFLSPMVKSENIIFIPT